MRILATSFLVAIATIAPTLAAQAAGRTMEVKLSSFDFTPQTINLKAGEPVVLHLVNTGKGGHDFAARQFFAAAAGVSGPVQNGKVEVAGHQAVDVRLTPARGTYQLRCTHSLHTAFGMKGKIIVQ